MAAEDHCRQRLHGVAQGASMGGGWRGFVPSHRRAGTAAVVNGTSNLPDGRTPELAPCPLTPVRSHCLMGVTVAAGDRRAQSDGHPFAHRVGLAAAHAQVTAGCVCH